MTDDGTATPAPPAPFTPNGHGRGSPLDGGGDGDDLRVGPAASAVISPAASSSSPAATAELAAGECGDDVAPQGERPPSLESLESLFAMLLTHTALGLQLAKQAHDDIESKSENKDPMACYFRDELKPNTKALENVLDVLRMAKACASDFLRQSALDTDGVMERYSEASNLFGIGSPASTGYATTPCPSSTASSGDGSHGSTGQSTDDDDSDDNNAGATTPFTCIRRANTTGITTPSSPPELPGVAAPTPGQLLEQLPPSLEKELRLKIREELEDEALAASDGGTDDDAGEIAVADAEEDAEKRAMREHIVTLSQELAQRTKALGTEDDSGEVRLSDELDAAKRDAVAARMAQKRAEEEVARQAKEMEEMKLQLVEAEAEAEKQKQKDTEEASPAAGDAGASEDDDSAPTPTFDVLSLKEDDIAALAKKADLIKPGGIGEVGDDILPMATRKDDATARDLEKAWAAFNYLGKDSDESIQLFAAEYPINELSCQSILRIVRGCGSSCSLAELYDVARTYLDFISTSQLVFELAEKQNSNANNRIPLRASLGTMMSLLEDSEKSGKYENQPPLVKAAIDAVQVLEGTAPDLERLREQTKLSTNDRGLLGALLNLVAVVVGLSNKPVSTISKFPPPSQNELTNFNNTKSTNDICAKNLRIARAYDEAVIKVGFDVFCPDFNYDTSSTLELVESILMVLASDGLDDSPLRDLALSVIFVVFGQRFVNDDAPWKAADSFSLFPDEEANPVPFFEGNNDRRKVALQHSALLFAGKQYEDVVKATEGLVLDATDSFQMAWLRTSVSNTRKIPASVRNEWMALECFAAGSFAGEDKSIKAMKKTLNMSKKRKNGTRDTRGFWDPKLILFRLDVDKSTIDGSASLVRRLCSS